VGAGRYRGGERTESDEANEVEGLHTIKVMQSIDYTCTFDRQRETETRVKGALLGMKGAGE
jgi:hypothetical protein